MVKTKYGEFIKNDSIVVREATDMVRPGTNILFNPEVVAPSVNIGKTNWNGSNLTIAYVCITQPFLMIKESHAHDFDQYLCFIGGNPTNVRDFGAEIEMSLGKEGEKHIINTTAIIYIPKGLIHCPLNFKRVDKPVVFIDIALTTKYERKPVNK